MTTYLPNVIEVMIANAPFGDHMHNNVHDWVRKELNDQYSANDPIHWLHHYRVLESWMQKSTNGANSSQLLPAYVPVSGGHPGHNRDDYMVPFFLLIRAGEQYSLSYEWGYIYDSLVPALIPDSNISDCSQVVPPNSCPICDANTTCINCTNQTCPPPHSITTPLASQEDNDNDSTALALGLGLGLGLALMIAIQYHYCLYYSHLCNSKITKAQGSRQGM